MTEPDVLILMLPKQELIPTDKMVEITKADHDGYEAALKKALGLDGD